MLSPDEIFGALRPHQPALVRELFRILESRRTGVDLSDTGAGKTYVSCAVAALRKRATLVVGPRIAEGAWTRAAKHFGDSISFVGYEKLRAGNTPFGKWSKSNRQSTVFYVCANCQQKVDLQKPHPCYCHPAGIHCLEVRKKAPSYGTFSFVPEIQDVIFDEVHRCGGMDSLNADLLIAAKRQQLTITGLSGTVACNPLNMRALGYALDLHNLDSDLTALAPIGLRIVRPNFKRWAGRYGCVYDPRFHGWKWLVGAERQQETMLDIRNQIIPERGVRVGWRDIPGFPDRQILAELYNFEDVERINALYQQMQAAVDELRMRASSDKDPELSITQILRARQEVELLKVPVFAELAQDYLDKGITVVFFVNFKQTLNELHKRFPDFGILDGQSEDREGVLAALQSNRIRGLCANSRAGSECCDMHDLDGFHPRVGLVSLPDSVTVARQLFGRLHRNGAQSPALYRVILADGTIENEVQKNIAPKLDNIDTLNDGDLQPENLRFSYPKIV
jgi:superfamily II DNA or RNA helicase